MYTIQKEKKQPKIIHTELAGILISVYSNNVKLSQLMNPGIYICVQLFSITKISQAYKIFYINKI